MSSKFTEAHQGITVKKPYNLFIPSHCKHRVLGKRKPMPRMSSGILKPPNPQPSFLELTERNVTAETLFPFVMVPLTDAVSRW